MYKRLVIHICLFLFVFFFTDEFWPEVLLLLAQFIFVPVMFLSIVEQGSKFNQWYPFIAIPAYIAISISLIFPSLGNGILSLFYLVFTFYIGLYGLKRFFHRGFTHIEEFVIDTGLIFLPVGGMWFVAHALEIDTGFSSLITWLTAIHFHYSAFLMLVFVGLLGRLWKSQLYPYIASLMIVLPWVMAVGISLSRWVELVGVIVYVVTVFALIIYSFKVPYFNRLQKLLVASSFSSVGLTIIFACMYVLSNSFSLYIVSIDWMLIFHGITNAFVFGLFGCIGWFISIPKSNFEQPNFPLSPIRKKFMPGAEDGMLKGLVDNMGIYEPFIQRESVAQTIIDFYESTMDYKLLARIHWHTWFKPFAFIYRQVSRFVKQINLPLSSKQVKMTGNIFPVDEGVGGRESVRAWVRKIKGEIAFVALYSFHTDGARTYMNIALPLPFTSMHGILAFNQFDQTIELTSERKDETMEDAGIYLAIGKNGRFRLPLTETFYLKEISAGQLKATHKMKICGVRFLTIEYKIEKNSDEGFMFE